jgi:hypothetical protein
MTALTANRNTPQRATGDRFADPVKASSLIYGGALVVLDSSGWAVKASTATGLVVRGVAIAEADNSAGANGTINVETERGVFRFANSASTDAITRAEIGDACYIVDDQTVAKTDGSSTRSVAGTIVDLDAQGVWVRVGI